MSGKQSTLDERVTTYAENKVWFAEPPNPDICETDTAKFVKKLPKPTFSKGKLWYKASLFGDLLVR